MATVDKKYLDLEGLTTFKGKLDDTYIKKGQGATTAATLVKITTNEDGIVTAVATPVYNDIKELPGFVDNDTKNTAGSTNKASTKLYLVGAESQAANPQTYSNSNIYIGTDGALYSEGKKVALKEDVVQAVKFRGTIGAAGSGATITELPTASVNTCGDMYKVITDGTYGGIAAKVGDTFVCYQKTVSPAAYEWLLIPSGDEPSGTVTNVATGQGLTGGPITTSGTISHANGAQAASSAKVVRKFGYDAMGHVVDGGEQKIASDGAHTHDVTASGSVSVPTVSEAHANYNVHTTNSDTFIKTLSPTTQKLVKDSVKPAKNLTTGLPTRTVFGTATTASKVSIGSATASKATVEDPTGTIGSANVGTAVVYGKANVGTAVVYGTADVGSSVSIVPAKANGTASKATAGTARAIGNANVGAQISIVPAKAVSGGVVPAVSNGTIKPAVDLAEGSRPTKTVYSSVTASKATAAADITYGNANVGAAATVVVNPSVVSNPVAGTNYAYKAEMGTGDDSETLILTPLSLATAAINQATASSTTFTPYTFKDVSASNITSNNEILCAKAGEAKDVAKAGTAVAVATVDNAVSFTPASSSSEEITPYTFADVNVATVDSAVSFTPAVAAPSTQKLTPAVAAPSTQTLTPAAASSKVLGDFVTFADVSASTVSASDVSVPVISSNADVTVAVEDTAKSFATGALDVNGAGASVMTSVSAGSTGTAVGSVSFRANTTGETGGVALVNSVTIGSESKTVSSTGTTASNGAHTHVFEDK